MRKLIYICLIVLVMTLGYFALAQEKSQHNRSYPAESIRNDYTGVNVTTGAWVELDASMMTGIKKTRGDHIGLVQIFDSSGQTMELGIGAAGSEARILLIEPGGNGKVPIFIPTGARLAIRAVSADATVGEIIINTWFEER
ncbi:MAG: hypothetical protein ACXABY_06945 [Candidatus Thorarchaeota archaeon]|jgi:hypothetical protein